MLSWSSRNLKWKSFCSSVNHLRMVSSGGWISASFQYSSDPEDKKWMVKNNCMMATGGKNVSDCTTIDVPKSDNRSISQKYSMRRNLLLYLIHSCVIWSPSTLQNSSPHQHLYVLVLRLMHNVQELFLFATVSDHAELPTVPNTVPFPDLHTHRRWHIWPFGERIQVSGVPCDKLRTLSGRRRILLPGRARTSYERRCKFSSCQSSSFRRCEIWWGKKRNWRWS